MLDDGRFLNSLLPADFIPSTSDHLFWDWNLESCWVPWDLHSSVAGSLAIDSFLGIHQCPWSMDPLKCLTSKHIFTLVLLHYVPWFPFSLSMGYHASVNGIHQWPIIRRCSIMFDLDTFICMMGHVLVSVCVEYLWAWWNSTYDTSLIVSLFMRCQLSWPYSCVL